MGQAVFYGKDNKGVKKASKSTLLLLVFNRKVFHNVSCPRNYIALTC